MTRQSRSRFRFCFSSDDLECMVVFGVARDCEAIPGVCEKPGILNSKMQRLIQRFQWRKFDLHLLKMNAVKYF